MDELLKYLNSLPAEEREAFAKRCGTTVGYLRKACSVGTSFGDGLCINIERESGRRVLCERLRPDIDWAYLRNTSPELSDIEPNQPPDLIPPVQAAIKTVAEEAQTAIRHLEQAAEAEIKHVGAEALLEERHVAQLAEAEIKHVAEGVLAAVGRAVAPPKADMGEVDYD